MAFILKENSKQRHFKRKQQTATIIQNVSEIIRSFTAHKVSYFATLQDVRQIIW